MVLLHPAPSRTALFSEIRHSKYDHVFLCDYRDVGLEHDGIRFDDIDLRIRLDSAVRSVMSELDYRFTILSGNRLERLSSVLQVLN
ncbi:AAA family ATPase [Arthrobacter dokdonensis]|uniref:AAA family ATPase n=1 Tax=Arthrobacter dokdonellae TaxID=2211210 RepID=UPI003AAF841F